MIYYMLGFIGSYYLAFYSYMNYYYFSKFKTLTYKKDDNTYHNYYREL